MLNPKTEVHPMIWNHFEADRAALGTQYTEEHWDEGSGLSPEALRQTALRRTPKYGNGDPAVDALAAKVMRDTAACINGRPNGRGASSAAASSPSTIA